MNKLKLRKKDWILLFYSTWLLRFKWLGRDWEKKRKSIESRCFIQFDSWDWNYLIKIKKNREKPIEFRFFHQFDSVDSNDWVAIEKKREKSDRISMFCSTWLFKRKCINQRWEKYKKRLNLVFLFNLIIYKKTNESKSR
jgi:hypothetical protein